MGRRGESIFKRKDGRWEARYKLGVSNNGSAKYRSVYGRTYSEAKEKRRSAMQQDYIPRTKGAFSEAVALWLSSKECDVKESTLHKYKHCINAHILPFFGSMRCSAVSINVIEEFLNQKRKSGRLDGRGGLAPNTIRGICVILQSLLDYAYTNNLGVPALVRVKKPKPEKKPICIIEENEQRRMDAALLERPHDTNLAIYLALHTGMRIGEVCALKWDDIDFGEKEIHVNTTVVRNKGGIVSIGQPKSDCSARTIPITDKLAKLLRTENKMDSSEYVFVSPRKDAFLNPRTLQYRFEAFLEKNHFARITFHTLRHTFATRWIECGMDVKSLSEVLGHTSVQITLDIYVHSSKKLKHEAVERIEQITGQKTGQKESGSVV